MHLINVKHWKAKRLRSMADRYLFFFYELLNKPASVIPFRFPAAFVRWFPVSGVLFVWFFYCWFGYSSLDFRLISSILTTWLTYLDLILWFGCDRSFVRSRQLCYYTLDSDYTDFSHQLCVSIERQPVFFDIKNHFPRYTTMQCFSCHNVLNDEMQYYTISEIGSEISSIISRTLNREVGLL